MLSKQTNYPQLPKNITAEAADVGGRVVGEAVGVSANISDAQIASGIAQLNAAFSNTNGQGVDIKVQFQLATMDPSKIRWRKEALSGERE